MLRRASELSSYRLAARDGEIGRAKDFYFDDQHWTTRYLVADTGTWLTGRLVVISPFTLGRVDEIDQSIAINLTKQQIEDSPSISEHEPISRRYEADYYGYYGWPMYWGGPMVWGPSRYPNYRTVAGPPEARQDPRWHEGETNLRSVNEVTGHYFQATDGDIGHVEDFIIDDSDWGIRYLVVDTRNWWPGKKVLIPPQLVTSVDWQRAVVNLDVARQMIKDAPEYDPQAPISRQLEHRLFAHYQLAPYWTTAAEPALR